MAMRFESRLARIPERDSLSPRRTERAVIRLSYDRAAKGVSNDQPLIFRQQVYREITTDGKVERIAKIDVVAPLHVGFIVSPAGLDFDHRQLALSVQPDDIGSAAVRKGKFNHRRAAQIVEKTQNASGNVGGNPWPYPDIR